MNIISGAKAMYDSDRNYNEAVRQYEQNQANWEKEFTQNQANWDKSFEYQQLVNDTTWAREDNAVQRRQADLAAAGINPMLAGLGSAQSIAGGVISPIFHSGGNTATGVPNATQADFGTNVNHLGKAIEELEKRKSEEKLQQNDIDAKLELQKREIEENIKRDDKRYIAEKSIESLRNINQIIRDRLNAQDEATQNALDRTLQWNIATHKALRSLFENSEIPMLDNIWKALFDSLSEEEYEMIRSGKFGEGIAKKIKDTWNKYWEAQKSDFKFEEDEKGKYYYTRDFFGKPKKVYIK